MFIYTVTSIFGVDQVKTRVFRNKESAREDINSMIRTLSDPDDVQVIEKENETYFIVSESNDPTEYIEFVLRRCEIR